MLDLSKYSCDKCKREGSWHCKRCWHTVNKKPTHFKPKNKTGIQTPEFRKPTPPPPPPTSGSNARKPNPNYVPPASVIVNCGHQPTYTSTQNPPDVFSSLLKNNPPQILPNDIGTVTYICPYETPCGWCTKWDKKCDKKISYERGLRVKINPIDDAIDFSYGKCLDCKYDAFCDQECNPENNFKYFQPKENKND